MASPTKNSVLPPVVNGRNSQDDYLQLKSAQGGNVLGWIDYTGTLQGSLSSFGGAIQNNQVVVGTGTNTVGGSSAFTFASGHAIISGGTVGSIGSEWGLYAPAGAAGLAMVTGNTAGSFLQIQNNSDGYTSLTGNSGVSIVTLGTTTGQLLIQNLHGAMGTLITDDGGGGMVIQADGGSAVLSLNPTGRPVVIGGAISTPAINSILYVDGVTYTTIAAAVAALPTATIGGSTYHYGEVHIPSGDFTVSSLITVSSPYVTIIGAGSGSTRLHTTTTGDTFLFAPSPFTVYNGRGGLENMTIVSNGSASQVGVHTQDLTTGFVMHDVVFDGFTGTGAIGWWAEDKTYWTERTNLNRVWFNHCTTGILLSVTTPNVNNSFGHQTWIDVQFNLAAGQTAVEMTDASLLYGSVITGVINNDSSTTTTNAFVLTGTAQVDLSNFLNLLVDNNGGSTINGVNAASGTVFQASGNFAGFTTNTGAGTVISVLPIGGSVQVAILESQSLGIASNLSTPGTWIEGNIGAAGNYYQGVGFNLRYTGSSWVTAGDGVNNGGSAILSTESTGQLRFYVVPSTGGTGQTVTPANLDSLYLVGTLDSNGLKLRDNAATSQKTETAADASVLSFTPPSAVGTYRIRFTASVSAASSAVLGWTATWTDSNTNAQTPANLSLVQSGTALPALTFTTSSAGNYYGDMTIDVSAAGTAVVVKFTLTSGTITAKVSATIERLQ